MGESRRSGVWRPGAVALLLLLAATACSGDEGVSSGSVAYDDVANQLGMNAAQAEVRFAPDCLFNDRVIESQGCEIERMSGAVAVGDIDGDRHDDLFFTSIDGPGSLWKNEGNGRMSDVTQRSGLGGFDLRANGAGWADIDNDGDQDLYLTTIASDRFYLFVNDGTGRFSEQAVTRGVDIADGEPRAGFSVNFGDIDNDGWIDIHLTEWLNSGLQTQQRRSHARLLRNRGAEQPGYFTDVTESVGVTLGEGVIDSLGTSQTTTPVYSFASALVDLDDDGWQDLVVSSDYGTSQLFWNNGDGTFADGTPGTGIGFEGNAMGLTVVDVDGNGTQDLFFTAIFGRANLCQGRPCAIIETGNRLFLNNGDRTFTDATDDAGVRDGAWGWGSAALDADNNGTVDLVMTNGIRFDGDDASTAASEPWSATPKRLWLNDGTGTFTEVAQQSGITTTVPGSGLAVFDLDGNGALDIVMVHPTRAPSLWRHAGTPDNAWLGVRVTGTDSNRDAHGAVVEVTARNGDRPQVRHVGANSHFLGQSTRTVYVGLGPTDSLDDDTVAEVRVRFPATGRSVTLTDVPANQIVDVTEPAS
jgi:hypothetical protein